MKDEPERGFAFLTGYNGNDKCQTGEIKFTTPFLSGKCMIIAVTINININISVMIHSLIQTLIMIILKLSVDIDIYNIYTTVFGIQPTY